jgi:hypothetical protein
MKYAPAAFLFAAFLLQGVTASAQIREKTIIHSGDSLSNYFTFLFPSFRDAKVKMHDGRSVVYKMNFNLLLCDMEFIDAKGDSLVIDNPAEIDSILLDSCLFIYVDKKGYFQSLSVSGDVSLAVSRVAAFEPVPFGGKGAKMPSGGVVRYNSLYNRGGSMPLFFNQDIYALRTTSFLIFYMGGQTEDAGKAAFMRIYHGDKGTFDEFVKTNKINFNKQGDLEKLFHFCTQAKM